MTKRNVAITRMPSINAIALNTAAIAQKIHNPFRKVPPYCDLPRWAFGAIGEMACETQLGRCVQKKCGGEAHRHLHELGLSWQLLRRIRC